MSKHNEDLKRQQRDNKADAGPPGGQGHQPLPGESPSSKDGQARRKHVQNADLPEGEGHQTLPGEDPPSKR